MHQVCIMKHFSTLSDCFDKMLCCTHIHTILLMLIIKLNKTNNFLYSGVYLLLENWHVTWMRIVRRNETKSLMQYPSSCELLPNSRGTRYLYSPSNRDYRGSNQRNSWQFLEKAYSMLFGSMNPNFKFFIKISPGNPPASNFGKMNPRIVFLNSIFILFQAKRIQKLRKSTKFSPNKICDIMR